MTEEEMQAAIAKAVADAQAKHDAELEGLKRKNDDLLAETKAEREKRRAIEAAKAEADAAAEAAAHKRAAEAGDVDALKAQWEAKYKRDVEAERVARQSAEEALSRRVIDGGIRDALHAAGVAGGALGKGAALAFRDGRKIEISDGEASVDGVPLAQAVATWAAGEDGSPFKAASQASGGGAPGGGKSAGQGLAGMNDAARLELARTNPAALKALSGRA